MSSFFAFSLYSLHQNNSSQQIFFYQYERDPGVIAGIKIIAYNSQSVETIFINSRKLERFPGSIYDFHQLKNLDISRTAIDLTKPGNPLLKNLIRENVWAVALLENASISISQRQVSQREEKRDLLVRYAVRDSTHFV